jgi:molybdopterin synthase sulfur carrier subunit
MEWKLFADLAEVAGDRRIEVTDGDTAGEALDALLDGRPALRERVLDGEGTLQEHVTVLRNGETLGDLSASVEAGDELALMPPVSGG